MLESTLTRKYTSDGTFGDLVFEGFACVTVERLNLGNQHIISCIPEGSYLCKLAPSTKNLKVGPTAYLLQNVPDRTAIQIHIANYPADVEGCIGLGQTYMPFQKMITNSVHTVKTFMAFTEGRDFMLHIVS